jgi:hypothetical protein
MEKIKQEDLLFSLTREMLNLKAERKQVAKKIGDQIKDIERQIKQYVNSDNRQENLL